MSPSGASAKVSRNGHAEVQHRVGARACRQQRWMRSASRLRVGLSTRHEAVAHDYRQMRNQQHSGRNHLDYQDVHDLYS
jgi:hypothetical protein